MAGSDRERWDRRYAAPSSRLKKGPHDLLVRHTPSNQPGSRALELACGLGRDALWLAAQGYRVDALDISMSALRYALAEMHRREIAGVRFIQADLDHIPLARAPYDLVIVFRFLDRQLFSAICERVRPGGLVIYQTLNVRQLDRHPATNTKHLLQPGELPSYFPGWTVIEAGDEGPISSFVGRKPQEG